MLHLLSIILAISSAHFHFTRLMCSAVSVPVVLCLMMVLWILSFHLTLSIFLPIAGWLVSSFFSTAFVRDHKILATENVVILVATLQDTRRYGVSAGTG